jgi:lipoprotein-anchoring transpeptidase ErfK/SrfK
MKTPSFLVRVNKDVLHIVAILIFFICGYIITTDIPIILFSQNEIDPRTLTGLFDTRETEGVFYGGKVSSQSVNGTLQAYNTMKISDNSKRIEVDLSNQQLYAFEGNERIFAFPISSGRWGRTPVGTFSIWGKLRYSSMSGGSVFLGTYFNLPNIPYAMYISNSTYPVSLGYTINGTYWHKKFGHPVSHGSIDLAVDDAEKLFYWIEPTVDNRPYVQSTAEHPGTPVVIYGTAPKS